LRWLSKIGLIRWGYEGLSVNEFKGLKFDTIGTSAGGRPYATKTGEVALERFGLANRTIRDVVMAQTKVAATCWFLSYLGLTVTKQKYEVMKQPNPSTSGRAISQ
jgi:hypothetical protein